MLYKLKSDLKNLKVQQHVTICINTSSGIAIYKLIILLQVVTKMLLAYFNYQLC